MLSILLPVNKHTQYFYQVIESLVKSVAVLDVPTQLVVITNNLNQEEEMLVFKELESYSFEKEVRHSSAKNLSDALNFGLTFCKYDLVARMDQDDITFPNRFKEQILYLSEHSNTALIGGQVILINAQNKVIGRSSYPTSQKTCNKQLKITNCFAHPAVMFRKNCVIAVGGYMNDFPMAEDYYLWVRLNKFWELTNLSTNVLKYRIHDSQVTSSNLVLQLSSTLQIIALNFAINKEKLQFEIENLLDENKKDFIKAIFSVPTLRAHSKFRASIAIMILRRGKLYTGSTLPRSLFLIIIALRSNPILTLEEISKYFLRIFKRFYVANEL